MKAIVSWSRIIMKENCWFLVIKRILLLVIMNTNYKKTLSQLSNAVDREVF